MTKSLLDFYRTIGSTDIKVSPIGLGTVKIGRSTDVKYPSSFLIPSDREVSYLLSFVKSLGINLIDTAPAYGQSEERLGKIIKNDRKSWTIATKTGEEYINHSSHFNFSKKHTIYSVERSLKRLQTDYIDLLIVHSNGDDLNILEKTDILNTLNNLKKDGKIRAFGFSGKTQLGSIKALSKSDLGMVHFNINNQSEKETIQYSYKNNKGILIKKGLDSGHLMNKYNKFSIFDNFNFILNTLGVSSMIIGSINTKHIQENVNNAIKALTKTI